MTADQVHGDDLTVRGVEQKGLGSVGRLEDCVRGAGELQRPCRGAPVQRDQRELGWTRMDHGDRRRQGRAQRHDRLRAAGDEIEATTGDQNDQQGGDQHRGAGAPRSRRRRRRPWRRRQRFERRRRGRRRDGVERRWCHESRWGRSGPRVPIRGGGLPIPYLPSRARIQPGVVGRLNLVGHEARR